MKLIFVGVVAAVVVAVAEPVRLDADGGGLALHVRARTGDVPAAALLDRFVRGLVVLAIVDAVAHLRFGYTPEIALFENEMKWTLDKTIQIVSEE